MALAMTPEQMRELDEAGFTVMESFIRAQIFPSQTPPFS